jgi:hypothetical protein
MYNRIIAFIDKNNFLSDAQHGFRSHRSTETALQDFINNARAAIDKKLYPIGLFLDLTKAYDVLDHQLLLEKLNSYGVRGLANSWFKSYLTDQQQYVEVTNSKQGKVTSKINKLNWEYPRALSLDQFYFHFT